MNKPSTRAASFILLFLASCALNHENDKAPLPSTFEGCVSDAKSRYWHCDRVGVYTPLDCQNGFKTRLKTCHAMFCSSKDPSCGPFPHALADAEVPKKKDED